MFKLQVCLLALAVVAFGPVASVFAQTPAQPRPAQGGSAAAGGEQQQQPQEQDPEDDGEDDSSDSQLGKLGFGIGLGFRWNVLEPDLIDEAEIDANGVVRVNKRSNTHTGFIFETHYLVKRNAANTFGVGPFVAAEAGSDSLISSVGLGLMLAWKVDDNGRGFGLGIGYSAQPSAKVLGSEFVEGESAPLGPDDKPLPIRLQERDKGAIQLILSVVF